MDEQGKTIYIGFSSMQDFSGIHGPGGGLGMYSPGVSGRTTVHGSGRVEEKTYLIRDVEQFAGIRIFLSSTAHCSHEHLL